MGNRPKRKKPRKRQKPQRRQQKRKLSQEEREETIAFLKPLMPFFAAIGALSEHLPS